MYIVEYENGSQTSGTARAISIFGDFLKLATLLKYPNSSNLLREKRVNIDQGQKIFTLSINVFAYGHLVLKTIF